MEDNFSFKFDTLNGECLLNGRKLENLKRSNNLTHNFEIISVFDGHGGVVSVCFGFSKKRPSVSRWRTVVALFYFFRSLKQCPPVKCSKMNLKSERCKSVTRSTGL